MPNKFVKLVHLVGFIIKKFVTMHGHINVKYSNTVGTRALYLVGLGLKSIVNNSAIGI